MTAPPEKSLTFFSSATRLMQYGLFMSLMGFVTEFRTRKYYLRAILSVAVII